MGSVGYLGIGLERASTLAPLIVVARVREIGAFRFPGSAKYPEQKEGASLNYFRVEVLRALKGVLSGEACVFSDNEWQYHTHAEVINELSFVETHYEGRLPAAEIGVGCEAVFFLSADPMPAGFPPGSGFLAFGESYDRVDREPAVVAALIQGPYEDFGFETRIRKKGRVLFPDGLRIRLLGGGHKRPMVGGPQCEFTSLELTQGEASGTVQLNHSTDPDGRESWATREWGPYQIGLRALGPDGGATVVVQKVVQPPPKA